ncbi:ABC transporter ATP-binding protein [Paenibacillus xylaniclasticus]|uniref:ABC transporter ATP-binding protein n=1 Tax=Paenibacillus xylaniclasticus TaxID=588083 RepID=UPI000FD8E654|nr:MULTISPECIES: ABC transporter ATP-binding protein [Paenibacillus]GFN29841.1 putative ABC transporter ATP-binding protein YhcH [Paenibacillus curdlanolyticus]
MSAPIVQLSNVTKQIGKRTIIDQLSLDLHAGEVCGFLGPNGSGKTTTIRMMVGLMKLSGGEITIKGHSIQKDYEKAIRQVGAIVENPEMYKYMSGYKNLIHFARMVPGITRQRIDEVVRLVGLEARIHDKVKTYSLGMRQRLGVAQAILHKPALLILDEPTNGLDPAGIRELRDYLRKLAKEEGITVFVSSHLLSEMELMCDRVAIIQNGKLIDERVIVQEGTTSNAAGKYRFDVDRPADALALLTQHSAAIVQDGIELDTDRETAAWINAQLVSAGIKVYGFRIQTKSLEEQFIEVTGGETIG